MRKMFFKKVQSTRFYSNGWVKTGTSCVNEERREMLLKHEFFWYKGYKNNIPIWFNLNKW